MVCVAGACLMFTGGCRSSAPSAPEHTREILTKQSQTDTDHPLPRGTALPIRQGSRTINHEQQTRTDGTGSVHATLNLLSLHFLLKILDEYDDEAQKEDSSTGAGRVDNALQRILRSWRASEAGVNGGMGGWRQGWMEAGGEWRQGRMEAIGSRCPRSSTGTHWRGGSN